MTNENIDPRGGENTPAEAEAPAPAELGAPTVDDLRAELDKLNKEMLLQRADFENARKRLERQKQEELRYASLPLVRDLITVVDTLDLALTHAAESDPMRQGVQMVLDNFLKTLERYGVRRIESRGQPFDPKLHEAMGMACDTSLPDNSVVMEQRSGYMLHDRLIRPAGVLVNRLPVQEAPPADGHPQPE